MTTFVISARRIAMKSLKIILYALIFILLSGFFLQEPAQAVTIGPAGNLGAKRGRPYSSTAVSPSSPRSQKH